MSKEERVLAPGMPPPPGERLAHNPSMLINEVSRLFFDRMRATDPVGSVLSQHGCRLILLALVRREQEAPQGEGLSQRDLVDMTHLKAPTVSGILQDMEREGLIRRVPDGQDARRTRVLVTPAGRAAHEEIRTRLHAMGERQLEGLSSEERETLAALLLRVRANLLEERHGK